MAGVFFVLFGGRGLWQGAFFVLFGGRGFSQGGVLRFVIVSPAHLK